MSYSLKQYYEALNGESSFVSETWYVNNDARHLFRVYSDFDCLDETNKKMIVTPTSPETLTQEVFSTTLNQKINSTSIIDENDGTERVELELDDRIITFIIDKSGSATWNDPNGYRYTLSKELISQIENNYPGNIFYNLVTYGSLYVDVLLFAVKESDLESYDYSSAAQLSLISDDSNFAGIRVRRKIGDYPSDYGGIDGEDVSEGFISRVFDENLVEGTTYYYKIYTYDNNFKFSKGVPIKVTPRDRIIPRGISIFKTIVQTDTFGTGRALIGRGAIRDDYTVGIWHMDEGEGSYVYDFSDSENILSCYNTSQPWLYEIEVASGISGLMFNGSSDFVYANDLSEYIIDFSGGQTSLTISAWVYLYNSDTRYIISSVDGDRINFGVYTYDGNLYVVQDNGISETTYYTTTNKLNLNQWFHICAIITDGDALIYINGEEQSKISSSSSSSLTDGNYYFTIGALRRTSGISSYFSGKMTEVSMHNTIRDIEWIEYQLLSTNLYNSSGDIIDTYYLGRTEDNGDRLVVLQYEIPSDFNFQGGNVRIVRNEKHIPSWEEDGDVIYEDLASPGVYYVQDSDDFVLGETYYYRIFSQNSLGNYCFQSDAYSLSVGIDICDNNDYYPPLSTEMSPPESPPDGLLVTGGNRKIYLRWINPDPTDDRVARVKIYYSTVDFPVVNGDGTASGNLIFTGSLSDNEEFAVRDGSGNVLYYYYVHRNNEFQTVVNGTTYYYTIFFIDKYGRASNYKTGLNGGIELQGEQLMAAATPSASADETIIPLEDISDINYSIVDSNSASLKWKKPLKDPEDIEAYFDQTVLVYASLTDEFGEPLPEDTPMKMRIQAEISREQQSDDVFKGTHLISFEDDEAYSFHVERNSDGVMKATLRMTSNNSIISQIKEATFVVQLKAYLQQNNYVVGNNTASTSNSGDSLKEYYKAVEEAADSVNNTNGSSSSYTSSGDVFEFLSKSVTVHFTNPWEVELENRDNLKVYERCYIEKINKVTEEPYLVASSVGFNGVYMKSSTPFVARVKLKYKGEPVESGSVQIAIWDAAMDKSGLCSCADSSNPGCSWKGERISISKLVTAPSSVLSVSRGYEEGYDSTGQISQIPISYVDVPLYAPDYPHAVLLYAKGMQSGYSSVKDMYILFQSILKIEITASSPRIDGKSLAEQQASVFIINPDYPNYQTNEYDKSLVTYPSDNTIVEWNIYAKQGDNRSIYSTDNVSLSNGIYSYSRNGTARSVFLGPIEKGSESLDEIHEISASIVYKGLSDTARQFIHIEYDPISYDSVSARFLMQMDGGWTTSGNWVDIHWMDIDYASSIMWADGNDYRRVKIHRNPRAALSSDFSSADCFRECASQDGNELIELSSNQIIHISCGANVEILHGDIIEEVDPYTGLHYLTVGEDGFSDMGEANIELRDITVSDITYFYVRTNQFIPDAKRISNDETCKEKIINNCLCLDSGGITDCDLPEWNKIEYISGTTTVFVNGEPLVLTGGGDFSNGIPPVGVAINEPLSVYTEWRKVIYYSENPSDESFSETEILVPKNDFMDEDGETYVRYGTDVLIRVKARWKNKPVPDGTPMYVSIGDNTANTYFIADRSIYYTQTDDEDEGYVDVRISARKVPKASSISEDVRIFCVYDELETIERDMGDNYLLTLDYSVTPSGTTGEPDIPIPPVVPPSEPHIKTMNRYDILSNTWDTVSSMSEARGNAFIAKVNNKIYVMGGLKNNSLDISKRTEIYDPLTDTWEEGSPMPNGRFAGMTAVFGNDIYTIGGIGKHPDSGLVEILGTVAVYHTDLNEWDDSLSLMPNAGSSYLPEMMSIAFGTSLLVPVTVGSDIRNYIYIIGGMREAFISSGNSKVNLYSKRILRYWVEGDEWEYSVQLREDELSTYQRISPISFVYNNKIIVSNGAIDIGDEFIYPNEGFSIDIEESMSKSYGERYLSIGVPYLPGLIIPKFQSSLVHYDSNPSSNDIYFILGGGNKTSSSIDLVEKISSGDIFTYESSYDENVSSHLLSMPVARHGAGAVWCYGTDDPSNGATKDYIYIVGGFTGESSDKDIEINFEL